MQLGIFKNYTFQLIIVPITVLLKSFLSLPVTEMFLVKITLASLLYNPVVILSFFILISSINWPYAKSILLENLPSYGLFDIIFSRFLKIQVTRNFLSMYFAVPSFLPDFQML